MTDPAKAPSKNRSLPFTAFDWLVLVGFALFGVLDFLDWFQGRYPFVFLGGDGGFYARLSGRLSLA